MPGVLPLTPAVACRQLAHFCHTTLAAARCRAADVEIGLSMDRCRQLQLETREALVAALPLAGVQDLSTILARIQRAGTHCSKAPVHANELAAVGRTLRACLDVREAGLTAASEAGGNGKHAASSGSKQATGNQHSEAEQSSSAEEYAYPALAVHASNIPAALQQVLDVIESTVDINTHVIHDTASEELQQVRAEHSANSQELMAEMRKWCQLLYQKKASDRSQPHTERDRFCCAVKAGHNGVRVLRVEAQLANSTRNC